MWLSCLKEYIYLQHFGLDTQFLGGRIRQEDRNTDLKKPWSVGLGATPDMSSTGFQTNEELESSHDSK